MRSHHVRYLGHFGLLMPALAWLLPLSSTPTTALLLVGAVLATIGLAASVRHVRGRLCERCVAAMPLNAPKRADRFRPVFRAFHYVLGSVRRVVLLFIAATVVALVAGIVPGFAWLVYVHWTVAFLVLVLASLHTSYQLWCPYCRDGGGGARERTGPPSIPQPL